MMKLFSVAIFASLFFASHQKPAGVSDLPVAQGCWTDWFDGDDPSGGGDWELLYFLRLQYRGKICKTPVAIEAQTLTGLSAAATGDVIYKSDTTTGFVCLNREQKKEKFCNDYRVRFSCPPAFCEAQVCWTQWFDQDDPSLTGDAETLPSLLKENPGKICLRPVTIEAQTLAGLSVAAAGDVIYKSDTTTGFVCFNRDQKENKMCNDYRVRFSCPPSFCEVKVCWTQWYDRDDPSGSGDVETLPSLHIENPGKICPTPVAIEAQTLTGLSAAAAGDVIYKSDTTTGFACLNKDQKEKNCNDYRVRFSCPPSFCEVCWTQWFDGDDPDGSGDLETLSRLHRKNPGKICPIPVAIEAQTLAGLSAAAAGDVIYKSDTYRGFVCRNKDQKEKSCNDYRVRFSCPAPYCDVKVCWTQWYDRDDPNGSGDLETLSILHKENPGKICQKPLYIEAVTTDINTPVTSTGEIIFLSSPTKGFVCRNQDQKSGRCSDYKVRFWCPC